MVSQAQLATLRHYSAASDRFLAHLARRYRLHPTDMHAMWHLVDSARQGVVLSPGDLGSLLALSGPATTAVIDRLERVGYVHRQPSRTDGRRVEIHLPVDIASHPGMSELVALGDALRARLRGCDAAQVEAMMQVAAMLTDVVETARESC